MGKTAAASAGSTNVGQHQEHAGLQPPGSASGEDCVRSHLVRRRREGSCSLQRSTPRRRAAAVSAGLIQGAQVHAGCNKSAGKGSRGVSSALLGIVMPPPPHTHTPHPTPCSLALALAGCIAQLLPSLTGALHSRCKGACAVGARKKFFFIGSVGASGRGSIRQGQGSTGGANSGIRSGAGRSLLRAVNRLRHTYPSASWYAVPWRVAVSKAA